MNEMPDLDPISKSAEQRKAMKFWIDHCHHLEKLLDEQKRIIYTLQNQYKDLVAGKKTKAPKGVNCVCCSSLADSIAECGHYFCSICTDRYHDKQCIECENFI